MAKTDIEWTDRVTNPITGCKKGCSYCYAEKIANRFWGDRPFTDVQFHPERLEEIFKWRKPQKVFMNSMGDLFGPDVKDEWLDKIFAVMALTPQHTYQILTKYPERMQKYLSGMPLERIKFLIVADLMNGHEDRYTACDRIQLPSPNVWLGVSCENQKAADDRIEYLLQTPAAIRFLSCEPLLGEIDLQLWARQTLKGLRLDDLPNQGRVVEPGIDWVIAGGMSGAGAKPCDLAWLRSLVRQCNDSAVPIFIKQLGSNPVDSDYPDRTFQSGGKWSDIEQFPPDLQRRDFPEIAQARL